GSRGAGVAGRWERGCRAALDELGGDAEGRIALAPERLRRALGHADDLRGVADLEGEALGLQTDDLAVNRRTVTDEDDGGTELPDGGHRALDHDARTVIASHRVHGDLQAGRRTVSVGHRHVVGGVTSRLGALDGHDLPPLVVPAVRADPMRQLGLAALRTDRTRGCRELVVGAALPAARLGMASFRQRHRILLVRKPRSQVLEGGQPGIRRALSALALDHISVPAANPTEPKTAFAAQRLHG